MNKFSCNQSKSGNSTRSSVSPATPQTATTQVAGSSSPLPPALAQPEKYHAVDSAKAGLSFELSSAQMEWDSAGSLTTCGGCNLKAIDAHGHSMPIALSSKRISDGGINTRDFGVIKVRFTHTGGFSMSGEYLMQDSHLKDLQQRLAEYVSAKQGSKAPVHQ